MRSEIRATSRPLASCLSDWGGDRWRSERQRGVLGAASPLWDRDIWPIPTVAAVIPLIFTAPKTKVFVCCAAIKRRRWRSRFGALTIFFIFLLSRHAPQPLGPLPQAHAVQLTAHKNVASQHMMQDWFE